MNSKTFLKKLQGPAGAAGAVGVLSIGLFQFVMDTDETILPLNDHDTAVPVALSSASSSYAITTLPDTMRGEMIAVGPKEPQRIAYVGSCSPYFLPAWDQAVHSLQQEDLQHQSEEDTFGASFLKALDVVEKT